jgi:hypothetical protein
MPDQTDTQNPVSDTQGETSHSEPEITVANLLRQAQTAQSEGDLRQALRLADEVKRRLNDQKDSDSFKKADDLASSIRKEFFKSEFGPLSTTFAFLFGVGIWVLIGFGIAAIFSPGVRAGWGEYWVWIPIGAIVLGLGLLFSRWYEQKLAAQSEGFRRAIATFTIVPLITVAMLAVITLSATGMAFVLEIIFILLASLIPAAGYYLFLAARRPSILNEFIANLSRLGLLSPRPVRRLVQTAPGEMKVTHDYESPKERCSRIEGYFQRFEAIYGSLRFSSTQELTATRSNFITKLVNAIDTKSGELPTPEAAVHITDMFRPNLIIPIGMVTILTTLGWLLVMQPDFYAFKSELIRGAETKNQIQAQTQTESQIESQRNMQTLTPNSGAPQPTELPAAENAGSTAADTGAAASRATSENLNRGTVQAGKVVAELTPVWTPVGLAFLGAYFFGVQMMFRRFVRRDLGPAAYLALTNRIILAVISVWVVLAAYAALENHNQFWQPLMGMVDAEINWPPIVMVIAFVVGVFPRVLWQFITAAVTKLLLVKAVIPSVEAKQPLSELDGLTIWHESRLEEEDVENVPNMATIDIVDVMLHTQIPAERLVNWVDQAILLVALGTRDNAKDSNQQDDVRQKVFALGLRKASQVVAVYASGGPGLQSLVDALGNPNMHAFVQALQFESNFDVVCAWRCVATEQEKLLLSTEQEQREIPPAQRHRSVKNFFRTKEQPLETTE